MAETRVVNSSKSRAIRPDESKIDQEGDSNSRNHSQTLAAPPHQESQYKNAPTAKQTKPAATDEDVAIRPTQLNESELELVHGYLKRHVTKLQDELDDDAVALRMLRMDRLAKQRVKLLQDVEADSEEEESRVVQSDAYRQEMDLITRHDFYKQVTHFAKSSNFETKKTMSWFKKRLGLQKRKPSNAVVQKSGNISHEGSCESEGNEDGDSTGRRQRKRRLTRGMARDSRVKKREERQTAKESWGLKSLSAAADDVEADEPVEKLTAAGTPKHHYKSVPSKLDNSEVKQLNTSTPKVSNKKSALKRAYDEVTSNPDLDLSGFVRVSKWLSPSERANMGLDRNLEIRITSIIVDRNNLEPILRFIFKSDKESREIRNQLKKKQKRPRVYQPSSLGETDEKSSLVFENVAEVSGLAVAPARKLRERSLSRPKSQSALRHPLAAHKNPRGVSGCSRLMNCLVMGGRTFARYEFFYSDIDRPWFKEDRFRNELSKRGVPPDTNFSRRQWSVIRSMVFKRPRRFSPQFIKQERAKLEQYRSTMRCLQHMGLPRPEDFSFEVVRPIEVGTTVTAIMFGSLHRGVVLDYNVDRCSYYIKFDKKELGQAFCLDCEVATYGVPAVLYGVDSVAVEATATGVAAERNQPAAGESENGMRYASVRKVAQEYRKNTAISMESRNGVVKHDVGNGHRAFDGNVDHYGMD